MATVKAVDLIDRCQTILQDVTGTRWPKKELLNYLNDAQREIVLFRPDAKVVNSSFTCVAGSKQTIPAAALRLIGVIRNAAGKSVRQIERQILDDQLPGWHLATGTAVEHYVFDPLDPKTFYVYPNALITTSLEIVYSTAPTSITLTAPANDNDVTSIAATTIDLDDVYANAMIDFMLYRAYSKDAEYAGNAQRAMMHYQAFANSLGIKTQSDVASTPRSAAIVPG